MNYYQSNYYATNHYGSDYYGPDSDVEGVTFFQSIFRTVFLQVNEEVLNNDECC